MIVYLKFRLLEYLQTDRYIRSEAGFDFLDKFDILTGELNSGRFR